MSKKSSQPKKAHEEKGVPTPKELLEHDIETLVIQKVDEALARKKTESTDRKKSQSSEPTPQRVLADKLLDRWGQGNLAKRVDGGGKVVDYALWIEDFGWERILPRDLENTIEANAKVDLPNQKIQYTIQETARAIEAAAIRTRFDDWDRDPGYIQFADSCRGFALDMALEGDQLPDSINIPKEAHLLRRWPLGTEEWSGRTAGKSLADLAPAWQKYLGGMLDGDAAGRLEAIIGQGLVAQNSLHKFIIMSGAARSGKSTFLNLLGDLWGADIIGSLPVLAVLNKGVQDNRVGLSVFDNCLVAKCGELPTEANCLNQGVIKDISGGDGITYRPHYKSFQTIRGARLLILYGNDLPKLQSPEAAIQDRAEVINFEKTIAQSDRRDKVDILDELKPEALEIMARLILLGLRAHQAHVLPESDKIASDTANWLDDESDRILRAIQTKDPNIWDQTNKIRLKALAENLAKSKVSSPGPRTLAGLMREWGWPVKIGDGNKTYVHPKPFN